MRMYRKDKRVVKIKTIEPYNTIYQREPPTLNYITSALMLMSRACYDIDYVGFEHLKFGANEDDLGMSVKDWLAYLDVLDIEKFMEQLKHEIGESDGGTGSE